MTFAAPAEAIYSAYRDRTYWDDLVEHYRDITAHSEITGFSCDGSGLDITFRQVLPGSQLPPIVHTLIPLDLAVTRVQHFEPYDRARDGAGGSYSASVPHAPGGINGTYALTGSGATSTLQLDGKCKVPVPLIGGKLEALVLQCAKELFAIEEAFTADWIARHQ